MQRGVSYSLLSFLALMAWAPGSHAAPIPQAAAMPVAAVETEKIAEPVTVAAAAPEEPKTEEPKAEEPKKEAENKEAPPAPEAFVAPIKETPAASPAKKRSAKIPVPTRRPGTDPADEAPVVDTDETLPLPPYPPKARVSYGALQTYNMGETDTLLDVARHFKLGYVELRTANPKVDPWTPVPGETVTLPTFHLLPRAPQEGIVVNLAQMRLYYFKTPGAEPITYPIGIGREGLLTPLGKTSIINKVANPSWFPTARMREEKPYLPAVIGPGPSNPMGTHALYLGWPEYRIHGTDKPWAIGRRVSSGCMRMYPEDIKAVFGMVPVGTKVTVVDQPILVGWIGDKLYLEAAPSKSQNIDIEINGEHEIKGLTDGIRKVIIDAAGVSADKIDWNAVEEIIEERRGYPFVIGGNVAEEEKEAVVEKKKRRPAREARPLFKSSPPTRYDYNR